MFAVPACGGLRGELAWRIRITYPPVRSAAAKSCPETDSLWEAVADRAVNMRNAKHRIRFFTRPDMLSSPNHNYGATPCESAQETYARAPDFCQRKLK